MQSLPDVMSVTQTTVVVVLLALFLAWETFRPFIDFFRGHGKERGVHLVRNLLLGGLNAAVIALVFVFAWAAAASWSETNGFGLLHAAGVGGGVRVALAILMLDAWTYAWHRLNHVVPFFWRFHRVHHADRHMDVTTAGRFHVGEIVLSSLLRIPLIALLGIHLWELLLYETLMAAVVLFHHANIGLPAGVDRALRFFLVTPAMHKVHHSRRQPETDSNFSAFLSIWDRIGRSFRLRDRPEEIEFGLSGFDRPDDETVGGMMRMPLQDVPRDQPANPETTPGDDNP